VQVRFLSPAPIYNQSIEMTCEFCNTPHDGVFGSGRFCNKKCASAFSTRDKRKQINERISALAKTDGRGSRLIPWEPGYDPRRPLWTDLDRVKAREVRQIQIDINRKNLVEAIELDEVVSKHALRNYLLSTTSGCGHLIWNGKPLTLEIHHRDGNSSNHRLSNCELLCPNCHSLTHNFRNKKR
jgi:hypothetical protein